jgi:hypothetical protein
LLRRLEDRGAGFHVNGFAVNGQSQRCHRLV